MCQSLRSKAATMMRRSASALSAWKLVGAGPGLVPANAPLAPPSRISAGTSSSAITSVSVAMIMRSTTFRSSRTLFRYHACVHGDRAVATHAADLALLDHPQQLRLRGQRQLADLVQEQGAPCGRLERPLAEHVRAGEGAALVPEQLVFDQALR